MRRRGPDHLLKEVERIGTTSAPLLDAFRAIDRADFVPESERAGVYYDRPVSLPEGQTTSQPSLIARMIDEARVEAGSRVLEIGTGYGYQTALLAYLGAGVWSIERHELLAHAARANLERAGLTDVEVKAGDGWLGFPEGAPFDAIIVSATASEVPEALIHQAAPGARLVIPLLAPGGEAVIVYIAEEGAWRRARMLTPARFVPLVREVEPEQHGRLGA
ncbi:MAG TPA: protein-L-isoaspartate(D-aspartate) O-methyltransferase [Actinomycetota bacterium]|nr:protein-L-isoaspartate(D-aspartate) O-methyltransferase [Actinomycetota bacterium]